MYQLCSIGCSRMMCSGQTESQGYKSWCRGYDKLVAQRSRKYSEFFSGVCPVIVVKTGQPGKEAI